MRDTSRCINCNTELTGEYCHNCGQKNTIKRITLRTLIEDFTSKWLGWDNKFLRTMKGLTVSPQKVVGAYIDGIRVNFVGPLGYTFLTTTIMILLYSFLDIDFGEMLEQSQKAFGTTAEANRPEMQELMKSMNTAMSENYRFMLMAMIPFLALSGVMFYANDDHRKTNYLEQGVLYFYLAGHTVWFSIVNAFVIKFAGIEYSWFVSPFSFIYTIFGVYQFHGRKGFKGVLKALFTYIIALIFFMIVVLVVTVIYMVFFTDFIQTVIENSRNAKGS
ncbi:MAG: DUF3667 domain-containing protein [Bacteroidota bacterium]